MKKVKPSSRSKVIEDIISIVSFVEALVLNHYVLVRKILSSSRLTRDQTSNPTSSTNTTPKVTMADNRTMAELLRAPTEEYAEAIVVPPILAEQFKLKHSLINMMTTDQFFGLEKDNPHDHIRWFNKITSTIKYKDMPNSAIKLIHFPFSLVEAACRWLEKETLCSITTWEDLPSKFINEFFPPSRTTSLRNEILNFQQKFDESFHEAWDRYKDLLHACPHHGGNLLERSTQDVLTIIENKSKVKGNKEKDKIGTKPDKIKIGREAWKSPTMLKSSHSQESRKREENTN
nr:reverse transcriptase domain-containing protein [Tanacetum cinerariifolium]